MGFWFLFIIIVLVAAAYWLFAGESEEHIEEHNGSVPEMKLQEVGEVGDEGPSGE